MSDALVKDLNKLSADPPKPDIKNNNSDTSAVVEQKVDPWDVRGAIVNGIQMAIDYDKLIDEFGSKPISAELLERFERVTGKKAHRFLRRGMFFSHRYVLYILIMSVY